MSSAINKLGLLLCFLTLSVGVKAQGQLVSSPVTLGSSSYNADWYLPAGNATGLVYLQHGFFRSSSNLRNLGNSLMDQGLMVLSVNANMSGGNAGLATVAADAIANGQVTPPNGVAMPQNIVLAGHSAGALHATLMGARLVDLGFSGFAGAILLDPVDANNAMVNATQSIVDASIPAYAIMANGGVCNSFNNAEPILSGLENTDFVGFKLTSSSTHVDAEGSNSDFFSRLFCGSPVSSNINDIQNFAAAWALDMTTGSYSSDYYPGGDAINAIINGSRGYLLK